MSTPPARRGQIATPEAVAAACDQLFRQGEAITEIAVRQALGGGSTPVIYRHIRLWEAAHRSQFLVLEAQAETQEAGRAPPDVPAELWVALKPAWERVVAQAAAAAEADVAQVREALGRDRAALEAESTRVHELDARWQAERSQWSEQISDLNTGLATAQSEAQALKDDITQHERRAAELAAQLAAEKLRGDGLQAQMASALADAQARHEADQGRWLQQIDAARQEVKTTAQQADRRETDLQRRLDTATTELADARIALELARVESNGRLAQLDALQGEHAVLREVLGRKEQQVEQLLAQAAIPRKPAAPGKRSRKPKGS